MMPSPFFGCKFVKTLTHPFHVHEGFFSLQQETSNLYILTLFSASFWETDQFDDFDPFGEKKTLESFIIHNFDNFLQTMAPGAGGDDKSKEEEKKVKTLRSAASV